MSGPSGVMDRCSLPRLKLLIVFLLVSTNIVCLHGNPTTGVNHDLRCVNDHLFTINCSLSITPSENGSDINSSYWLIITRYDDEKYVCMLTNNNGDYYCSVKLPDDVDYKDTFLDALKISLCHDQNNGSESCEELVDEYDPDSNITPNAPCRLTVSHNSSQRHFTWESTYKEIDKSFDKSLTYQLQYYKRGDDPNVPLHIMHTTVINYSVDDEVFAPDTKYAARVRTGPDQVKYHGQWSDWSSEVYWKTESAVNDQDRNTFVSGLAKVIISVCVSVPIALLVCYAPVKKWRQSAFIPTPAPYFHTLYSDCQGDFKSWVVPQENTADMLKAEETLQIDTLTKCAVVEEEEEGQPHFMAGRSYSNITDPGCDDSLLGIPYAVCTMAPLSSPGSSLQSLTLSSQPGSPDEGDSGCWLERDPPWYCNEYCTLSGFQQCPVPAEHQSTKPCPTGIIRVEAFTEA
ncbi:interleukin-21 receptor isoform X1 [Sebastes fasciatus]|uniref:interleukin-21 receptor isoform X1 n=1 Tax=Sebastes fasciatus TaxID=394691 RepID=UPI003D9E55AD